MKKDLVKERQPFGEVDNTVTMPSTFPTPVGMTDKLLGGTTMRGCDGLTTPISSADKNPSAYEQACNNRDNPFAWTGTPKGRV